MCKWFATQTFFTSYIMKITEPYVVFEIFCIDLRFEVQMLFLTDLIRSPTMEDASWISLRFDNCKAMIGLKLTTFHVNVPHWVGKGSFVHQRRHHLCFTSSYILQPDISKQPLHLTSAIHTSFPQVQIPRSTNQKWNQPPFLQFILMSEEKHKI